jgi:hypothetical protein
VAGRSGLFTGLVGGALMSRLRGCVTVVLDVMAASSAGIGRGDEQADEQGTDGPRLRQDGQARPGGLSDHTLTLSRISNWSIRSSVIPQRGANAKG